MLETPLGKGWSPEWVLAGFNHKPGSTAVPTTQDKRFNSINTLAIYLSQHPTYEVPGGTPHTEVTASRAQALHSQLVLSLAGAGQILAEWVRGVRSSNNRVLIQILGGGRWLPRIQQEWQRDRRADQRPARRQHGEGEDHRPQRQP